MQENQIVITTFYKFIDLPNFELIKEPLRLFCVEKNIRGTILLASEGINATISGLREDIDSFYQELENNIALRINIYILLVIKLDINLHLMYFIILIYLI